MFVSLTLSQFRSALDSTLTRFIGVYQSDKLLKSPSHHLSFRLLALQHLQSVLTPPVNLSWMFLFIHQVVYEEVAIKYPRQCRVGNVAPQTIRQMVNADLLRLLEIKTGEKPSATQLRGYKVTALV